jgi:hypothetical protein
MQVNPRAMLAGVAVFAGLLGTGAKDAAAQLVVATPGLSVGVGVPPVGLYPGYGYPPVVGAYPGYGYPPAIGVYPAVRPYPYPYAYRGPGFYGPRPYPHGYRGWGYRRW